MDLLLLNSLVKPEDAGSPGNLNGQTLFIDLVTADGKVLTGLGGIKFIDFPGFKRFREHRDGLLLASGVADYLNQSRLFVLLVELDREVILAALPNGRKAEEITVQRIGCGMFEKLVPVRIEAESGLIFIGIYGECGDRAEGAVPGVGIEGMDRRLVLVIVSVFIVPGLGCGAEIGGPFKPGFLEGLLDRVLAISVVGGMKSIASISFPRPPPAQESIQRSGMSMRRSSQKRR